LKAFIFRHRVAAFGQILRQDVLDLPSHGCFNVHASLLPHWRGVAPVPPAILAGDEIGVTIMQMGAGLDTGPILTQREEPIRPDDTRATLKEGVTYARLLPKEDDLLDWLRPAVGLDRRMRAFTPWPGAFTLRDGRLKVLRAVPLPG